MNALALALTLATTQTPLGGSTPPAVNAELREDGSNELREDGSVELRE